MEKSRFTSKLPIHPQRSPIGPRVFHLKLFLQLGWQSRNRLEDFLSKLLERRGSITWPIRAPWCHDVPRCTQPRDGKELQPPGNSDGLKNRKYRTCNIYQPNPTYTLFALQNFCGRYHNRSNMAHAFERIWNGARVANQPQNGDQEGSQEKRLSICLQIFEKRPYRVYRL